MPTVDDIRYGSVEFLRFGPYETPHHVEKLTSSNLLERLEKYQSSITKAIFLFIPSLQMINTLRSLTQINIEASGENHI